MAISNPFKHSQTCPTWTVVFSVGSSQTKGENIPGRFKARLEARITTLMVVKSGIAPETGLTVTQITTKKCIKL